jgi:Xaa-Pro aminopeptidase
MKRDIDSLMKRMGVDVIYAEGHASRDTNMYYLLNGANIFAHYVKKRGTPAYVVHTPIEREVAAKSGHRLININKYDRQKYLEKYKDVQKANAYFVAELFNDLKVKGSVIFYGNFPLGAGYKYVKHILKLSKRVRLHDGTERGLITLARLTKGEEEVVRIRRVRDAVIRSFNAMLDSARKCNTRNGFLMTTRKRRLLIGDLRKVIRQELFVHGVIDSGGMIVAQGRDAGVPHNGGRDRQPVRTGVPIVFDIFPQEIGGGYFFDFTRTVCFGFAPKHVKFLYNTVSCAHDYAISLLKVGKRTRDVEQKVCEFFERKGHKTFLSDTKTQVGYCHSLGHGLGLNIHESPYFNILKTNKTRIEPGMVFTIEPGLYYPGKGYGVRIEDVIHVTKKGKIVNLTKYPRRLVVPI